MAMRLRALDGQAPVGVVGAVATGLVDGGVLGVAAVYVVRIGQSPAMAAILVAVMQTGSLLMQWPLGWLSDRYERRVVILTASLVVAASSLAIALVGGIWPLALYPRSEEHTSELQSLMRSTYAVFCLKKKKMNRRNIG